MITLDDVRQLQERGVEPRVHGNGFIQLDLDPGRRLHFWGDPRLPRQDVNTAIHDHSFDFRSYVLRGRMINIEYAGYPSESGKETHVVYHPSAGRGEDTKLQISDPPQIMSFQPAQTTVIAAGKSYFMSRGVLHETVTDRPTVTLMCKAPAKVEYNRRVRVLVPVGQSPDNTFDRHSHDLALLWTIIYDLMR